MRESTPDRRQIYSPPGQGRAQIDESKAFEISLSRWQLVLIALAAVIFGWCAYYIIGDTAALHAAKSDPRAAVAWNSSEPTALDALAQQCLTGAEERRTTKSGFRKTRNEKNSGKIDEGTNIAPTSTIEHDLEPSPCDSLALAKELAQRALSVDPSDAHALRLLGAIADREGNSVRAYTLMRLAGARSWRDLFTQAWLFRADSNRGDFTGALRHLDAILRIDPSIRERIFPMLAAFTVEPQALRALAAILAESPPWRGWFLAEISERLASESHLAALFGHLRAGKTPPSARELQPYLGRLIRDKHFEEAGHVWEETLPPQRRHSGRIPFNGNFITKPDGLPFDWMLNSVPGADVRIVTLSPVGKRHALHIEFSGARVGFHNVQQLMLLHAGSYRLSGMVKAADLRTRRGLWWRISCANIFKINVPSALMTLGHSALMFGNIPWRQFEFDFTVPHGCPAQWLVLELPARIAPELQIEGDVWFTSLHIEANVRKKTGTMCRASDLGE